MFKKLLLLSLCLLLALPVLPAFAADAAVAFIDMKGREITLEKPAARIVAISAADCEILCAIGAEDLLVGRGAYCNYPESILDLPVVDSGSETNLEQIFALEPDVVVMNTMAQTVEQVKALEDAGIVVVVSVAEDLEGVKYAINMLGILTGHQEEAAGLITEMDTVTSYVKEASAGKELRVYYEISPLEYGLWTAGSGTFMHEIGQLCGLTNIFSDVEGWAEVSQEQILERDPQIIITVTADYGTGITPVEEICNRPGWQDLEAVKNGMVYNADNDQMTRPGPRLMEALQNLFLFLNPDAAVEPAA